MTDGRSSFTRRRGMLRTHMYPASLVKPIICKPGPQHAHTKRCQPHASLQKTDRVPFRSLSRSVALQISDEWRNAARPPMFAFYFLIMRVICCVRKPMAQHFIYSDNNREVNVNCVAFLSK